MRPLYPAGSTCLAAVASPARWQESRGLLDSPPAIPIEVPQDPRRCASRDTPSRERAATELNRLASIRWSAVHDHPPKPPEECVDVHRSPFGCSVIDRDRDDLPTPFAASSVKDHLDISMTGKTALHCLVHHRITTRNDQQMPPQSPNLNGSLAHARSAPPRPQKASQGSSSNTSTLRPDAAQLQAFWHNVGRRRQPLASARRDPAGRPDRRPEDL